MTEFIESARFDERFEGAFVDRAEIDAVEKIDKAFIRTVFVSFIDDALCRRFSHTFDAFQSEYDVSVDDVEHDVRTVDVGRVDSDAHVPRFFDVFGQLVGRCDFVRQIRRHEFRGVVALEPARAVCDDRIRGRVRFVKTVAGEGHHDFEYAVGLLFGKSVFDGACDEFFFLRHKDVFFLFAHSAAQHIRLSERKARDPLRHLHNLFLIHHDAVGFFEDVFQTIVGIRDRFRMKAALDKLRNKLHGTRPVERVQCDEVFEFCRLRLTQNLLHARRFELKDRCGIAPLKELVGFFIGFIDAFRAELALAGFSMLVDDRFGVADKRKRF